MQHMHFLYFSCTNYIVRTRAQAQSEHHNTLLWVSRQKDPPTKPPSLWPTPGVNRLFKLHSSALLICFPQQKKKGKLALISTCFL